MGNWAGVTVGRKESPIKKEFGGEGLIAVDLPGAYSMSPFSPEESITSGYVRDENPDAIVNIVDATNLSRSLFFTTQLLELGIPVVVALNKSDINEKTGTKINVEKLSEKLGCPVVETVSTGGRGLKDVMTKAASLKGKGQQAPYLQADIDMENKAAVEAEDKKRYAFVSKIVSEVETRKILTKEETVSDKIDKVITNPIAGILLFAAVMWGVFYVSQVLVGPLIADWLVGWIETFQGWVSDKLAGGSPFLQALIADGIVGGVGAVVGFLPLVMVMYFLIALLEDCGYMARVSVVLDPIFKRVGLSGKSVIPFVIGTGCGIPGIMATRTIRDLRERRATAMLTTFMPCGAKIPVIALIAGVFFPESSWVSPVMYFTGIFLIFIWALIVKVITGHKYRKSFFIMEMPEYKGPSVARATLSMLERAKAYIIKAATIILVCNAVVQIMQSFTWQFTPVPEGAQETSILASIATPFAVILVPLGFGVWQLAAAAVTGFIAKENVVGTLAVVYGLTNFIDVDALELTGGASDVAGVLGMTSAAALAYLMFNLFTPPCFAAIGAMNSELQSKKWLFGAIGLQLSTGYIVAFAVYQLGTLFTEGHLGTGFLPGLIAVALMIIAIAYVTISSRRKVAAEYAALHVKKAGAAA